MTNRISKVSSFLYARVCAEGEVRLYPRTEYARRKAELLLRYMRHFHDAKCYMVDTQGGVIIRRQG